MTNNFAGIVLLACALGCLPGLALAAPLDDLLTANTPARGTVKVEGAFDAVNSTLDVFKIRANDPTYSGTDVGDYKGAHLLAGYALSDRAWIDGGLWDRHITYRGNVESLRSWQAAFQYRFAGAPDASSSYGLRVGVWGNSAGDLSKSTPTVLFGQKLDSVNVADPKDLQYQADVLGTWKTSPHLALSAFAGGGLSSVEVGGLTAGVGDCQYALELKPSSITGNQIGQCGAVLTASFYKPVKYDVSHSLAYKASYAHLGMNVRWDHERWTVRGGYLFEVLNRRDVDYLITAKLGGSAYKRNNILDAELAWMAATKTDLFVRAEVMSNQFNGEIPFAYNAVTASKFNGKYGFLSFGLRSTF
jgi:hypothetical protein